jgi:hypothetical protein
MNRKEINSHIDAFFSKTKEVLSHKYYDLFENNKIQNSRLPLRELLEGFNKLNVTFDSVIENRVDYNVLASHYASQDMMPSKYTEKANLSSRFTGAYMINYVSSTQGEKAAKILMQNFQLKASQFEDTLQVNNVVLATDLCEYICKYYGADEVFRMGQHSVSLLKKSVQGQRLAQSPNVLSLFEFFCDEIAPKYVERNFQWSIADFGCDFIKVCGRPSEQLNDSFQAELKLGTSLPSLHAGIMKSLPSLIGDYRTKVETLKSIQNGDDCNVFHLTYSPIKKTHSKLMQ